MLTHIKRKQIYSTIYLMDLQLINCLYIYLYPIFLSVYKIFLILNLTMNNVCVNWHLVDHCVYATECRRRNTGSGYLSTVEIRTNYVYYFIFYLIITLIVKQKYANYFITFEKSVLCCICNRVDVNLLDVNPNSYIVLHFSNLCFG